MESHIIVPRSVFDEFVNDKKYFFKYEVENNRISMGHPKSTYTEENYYSEMMEKKLNRYVETPLKALLNYARELPTKDIFVVDDFVMEIANVYVKSLFARSPLIYKSLVQNSIYLQFASIPNKHDLAVDYAMGTSDQDRFKDEYDFTFMVNHTKTPFVIPTRGLYEFSINKVQCINVPLNPWCSLLLKEKGKKILREVKSTVVVVIPDGMDDIALRINGFAFEKQKSDGIGYVVSYDKALLTILKQG